MTNQNIEKIAGIILGILGGLFLYSLLSEMLKQNCPKCGQKLENNFCKSCGFGVIK